MVIKEPWESYPELWKDQKAFMSYLRGAFRSVWASYPAKHVWKKAQMRKPPAGYVGKAKSVGNCVFCGELLPASKLEVDHVTQAGSFSNKQEGVEWLYKLLDTNHNWQLTCNPCHKIKSLQERTEGMTFEQARVSKEIIRLLKKENAKEMLQILSKAGYNGTSVSNNTKRKAVLTTILNKEI